MNLLRKILGMVCLFLLPLGVRAQGTSVTDKKPSLAERNALQGFNDTIDRLAEDFITVSLVVCDPGDVLYSTLGHAALHLYCRPFDRDYIYTYEGESVTDKIWKFLKGDLKMGMIFMEPKEFISAYIKDGRGVKEYKLNLSPIQEQKLWRVMDKHAAEGLNLPYDYFHNGCVTSIVNIMHEALGKNAIHYAPWSEKYTKHTMREVGCAPVPSYSWNLFVSYFLIGTDADKPCPNEQKLIVPTDLVEVWQQATLANGKPVLEKTANVLCKSSMNTKHIWCSPLLVCMLFFILSLCSISTMWIKNNVWQIAGNIIDVIIVVIITLTGTLMTYLICFSHLPCTTWNWLIVPFNILPALAWYWRKYWALPLAILLTIWSIVMAGEWIWGHMLVDWPHILLTMAFTVVMMKQYLKTK